MKNSGSTRGGLEQGTQLALRHVLTFPMSLSMCSKGTSPWSVTPANWKNVDLESLSRWLAS